MNSTLPPARPDNDVFSDSFQSRIDPLFTSARPGRNTSAAELKALQKRRMKEFFIAAHSRPNWTPNKPIENPQPLETPPDG